MLLFWGQFKATSTSCHLAFHGKIPDLAVFHEAHGYLQVLWDEHFAGLLEHGLRLQLLVGEFASARVKLFIARCARQNQVGWIGLVLRRHVNGGGVHGAGAVSGAWETWKKREHSCHSTGHNNHSNHRSPRSGFYCYTGGTQTTVKVKKWREARVTCDSQTRSSSLTEMEVWSWSCSIAQQSGKAPLHCNCS